MVEIERVLELLNKTNPSNVKKIGPGFRIKKGGFLFDSYSLFEGINSEMYELLIYAEGKEIPLQKFVYNNRNEMGDKKVAECYNVLHRKYLEWKRHEEEIMLVEAREQEENNRLEEEIKKTLDEEERNKSLKRLEKILS